MKKATKTYCPVSVDRRHSMRAWPLNETSCRHCGYVSVPPYVPQGDLLVAELRREAGKDGEG